MTTAPALAPLIARTVAISDPGPLLTLLPPGPGLAWVRHGEGLVGWGEAMRVNGGGESRFDSATRAWADVMARAVVRDEVRMPGTGPVAFGSFAFSPTSPAGSVLVVPEVVVGHRGDTWWLTTISADGALPAPVTLAQHERDLRAPEGTRFTDGARPREDWKAAVGEAIARIEAGEVEKVVLARDVLARTTDDVDPRDMLARLADGYPNCWTFSVDGLLGATPEMLVKLERGLVTSRVLAGTIRRTRNDEQDLALAASLARSSKDLEEHEYAVRSVAEALAPHCATTNVPDSPFVLHLPNVMHLATDVTAVLADGASSLDLAAALHPSAAVCGTPTSAAAKLIEAVEGMDRARYAGPVGWVDGTGDGEWGIALRSAQFDPENPRQLRLFAGCGIVAGSDPEAELAESEAKLLPVKGALSR
ncbi:chorismate-binding protein [Kineosporia sp. J2-2]|uniref:isochorismate synthase n=1 Tax=Kineosporia corallincola TaxID=2835133 RepID=A0ABS5T9M0_9ACTN|nr:chorismate-binding protein [Kineosporia corallincola]MBT0767766.1 chorismate-binding protein [Kineosporia corallincola]